jgi:hypothetical protein
MMKKIPFKLEIDGQLIDQYEVINNSFIFKINSQTFNLKTLSNTFQLRIICDSCDNKTILKNIQNRIQLGKPFLCRSCRSIGDKNGMFNRKHSDVSKIKMSESNSGENNGFYGKKHTKETILKQKSAKIGLYSGKNNPMYGKTFFDIWVEKYGVDIALNKLAKKSEKQRKRMLGENNPMYAKTLTDIWVEKYGLEKANELYLVWVNNVKNSLINLYENNSDLKNRISTSLKGRVFTDEHKLNLRLSSIEYIKRKINLTGGKMVPHFNIYACQLFDEISKLKNINIQHALNGGEYYIPELGYWVDGYDHKNNVVYEYYENEHKYRIEKDILRENKIKDFLNCQFQVIYEGKEIEFLKKIL